MNVIVKEYDEKWIHDFKEEVGRLKSVFGPEIVDTHHFGSTSVPGLKAKAIIDIMPLVKNIEKVHLYDEKMISLGYEPLEEFGIEGRRFFRKGGDKRTHHVHIFQFDNHKEIERHLAVRDYLRFDHAVAREYGKLKVHLSIKFPEDIQAYMNGKDQFVKELEKKALQWYKNRPSTNT